MIVFPAVDIKDGQAVRLRQGKAEDVTVFDDNPVACALTWQAQGARYLHVVDLDGAFGGAPKNQAIVREMCDVMCVPVQLGGGIRDVNAAQAYLDAGVTRLILGTLALEDPRAFAMLCHRFPGRVGVSLDAEGGRLKTRGWAADAGMCVDDVLPRLLDAGAAFVVYTDIARDGMQSGVNLPALKHLLGLCRVPVIAAGGVATLEDIQQLYPLSKTGRLEGVISGRALYEGTLKLEEALDWLAAQGG